MSCFGGAEERIYLADITVDKLKLTSDKMQDIGDHSLVINIKFIDFPIIKISRDDFFFPKESSQEDECTLEFSCGRSYLFTKQPKDVIQAMQSIPLTAGVFYSGDTYPVAQVEVPFSGCLCNQIGMAENDADHLPKPYILKGGFNLLDPGENPAGIIYLEFRLTCLGKFVTTHYHLQSKGLFFMNNMHKNTFCIERIFPSNLQSDKNHTKNEESSEDTKLLYDDANTMKSVIKEKSLSEKDAKEEENKVTVNKDKKVKAPKKKKKLN